MENGKKEKRLYSADFKEVMYRRENESLIFAVTQILQVVDARQLDYPNYEKMREVKKLACKIMDDYVL